MKTMAAAGLGMAAMPLLSRGAEAADEALVYTWSGYNDPKLYPAYVTKHGSPTFSFLGDTQEALNKLRAGYVCDVAHPCSDDIFRYRGAGVIKPFDPARLTYEADFWPELAKLPGTVGDDGKRWFVPFDWGNSSIIYRTDLVDVKEPSWKLIYSDERYKGRVAMYDSAEPAVQIAASILGLPDIWVLNDDELKKTAELLRTQRELVRFYWSDETMAEQGLASGELVAAYGWNDGVRRLKKQGLPVAFMVPKEGVRTWVCGLVMYKNPPHEDLAYDFVNAFTSPDAGVQLLDAFGTGHVNRKAFERVDQKTLDSLGLSNPTDMMKHTLFLQAVPEAQEKKYNQLFTAVKAGG
jgi:spermidine/putrescine transport system substrate-binding protein